MSLFHGREQLAEAFLRHSDEIRKLPAALEESLRGGDVDRVLELSRRFHGQVFQGPIDRAFRQVRRVGPVRLRIRAEPPEIARIPWESLDDGEEPLSVARQLAFSRLPMDAGRGKVAPRETDVGVLVATAEVDGMVEAEAIEEALDGLRQDGLVHLVTLRAASLDDIRGALAGGRFRAVAIVAPGPLGTDGSTGYLRLAGEGGRLREHAVTEVAPHLYGHQGLRFVFLSVGCRPEREWRGESFEGLVRLCFGMRVSAALSMPYPLRRPSYVRFLRAFFEGAVSGHALDVAAGAARRALRSGGGIEFALPVVYASDPFCLRVMEGPPQRDLDELAGSAAPAAGEGRRGEVAGETSHSAPTEELFLDASILEEEVPEQEAEMEQAVERFAREGDWMNQAAAMDHLGRYQARRGRIRKAVVTYQGALDLLREHGEERSRLPVMLHLAEALRLARDRDRALETHEELLVLARKLGDHRKAAVCLTQIGERRKEDADLEEAVRLWEEALEEWRTAGDDGRAAETLTRIGAAHQSLGRHDRANESFEAALYTQRQREDRVGMATSLNNLGNVATRRGRRDEAVTRYSEALDLFRQVDSREGIASVCHNLANISLALGDHRRCIELAREAADVASRLGIGSLEESSRRLLQRVRQKLGEEDYRKMEEEAAR